MKNSNKKKSQSSFFLSPLYSHTALSYTNIILKYYATVQFRSAQHPVLGLYYTLIIVSYSCDTEVHNVL